MLQSYSDLDEEKRDMLKELGNIGTGNAITSLSQMIDQPLEMEIPKVCIVPFQKVPDMLGGAETIQVGILLEVSGDLSGTFMFLLNEEFAKTIIEKLVDAKVEDIFELDELSKSAISEIGNIMCCSYINALSLLLHVDIHVSLPAVCCDMAGAILSVPMIKFAHLGDELLFIENRFQLDDVPVVSHILFFPDFESLNFMFQTVGSLYE
jgi:chemotaxis protein CheC